ncbi:MAG: hypothetical protein CVU56_03225 [Deltaproteobacteria bacterium HGW-Deltaproteobacteria-14]|nr:MAG: hypothetical protein CVU56_03225 [Deltaproteobacteria bacterium HGW-Deltaproteobacteria-14]
MSRLLALSFVVALGTGCAEDAVGPAGRVAISVAPLSYPGVTNATYTLEVRNAGDDVVFTRTVDSRGYGSGDGSASYVGPCDADAGANPNTVTLTLTGLYAGAGGAVEIPATSYHNPGPLTRSVACAPNADVAVIFDVTLARQANQGFFDVAVAFSNVFCSAKLDCVDADGDPLLLLHDADGARARTVVVGLACTGDAASGGETWLYHDAVTVTCTDGTALVDPSAGPGNLSEGQGIQSTGTAPLFGAAVYRGTEQLGFNKRYWNVLVGLAPTAAGCTVTTAATASPDAFDDGRTPAGTTWPYIDWDVDVTAAGTGALACTTHPVNGAAPHDGVATLYSGVDTPESFTFSSGPTAPSAAPTILAVTPGTAPAETQLTLSGTGFLATDTATVGGVDCAITYVDATSLRCDLVAWPAHSTPLDVVVSRGGFAAATLTAGFQRTPTALALTTVESGTWTAPPGVTAVAFELWGGGGGGGGVTTLHTASGGGGGYSAGTAAVTPDTSYGYTVGAGGAAGRCDVAERGQTGGTSAMFGHGAGGGQGGRPWGSDADAPGIGGTGETANGQAGNGLDIVGGAAGGPGGGLGGGPASAVDGGCDHGQGVGQAPGGGGGGRYGSHTRGGPGARGEIRLVY